MRAVSTACGARPSSTFYIAESYAWPEPLGPPWSPVTTPPSRRWQVVLETRLAQRAKHSPGICVTKQADSVQLEALLLHE